MLLSFPEVLNTIPNATKDVRQTLDFLISRQSHGNLPPAMDEVGGLLFFYPHAVSHFRLKRMHFGSIEYSSENILILSKIQIRSAACVYFIDNISLFLIHHTYIGKSVQKAEFNFVCRSSVGSDATGTLVSRCSWVCVPVGKGVSGVQGPEIPGLLHRCW